VVTARRPVGGMRRTIATLVRDFVARFDDFKREHRVSKADQGMALALVLGILFVLGMLAGVTATGSNADTVYIVQSDAALASSSGTGGLTTDVVTETVKREGRTVHVVRHRTSRVPAGSTLRDFVTLPARTVRETVTTRDIGTVTALQTVTVTAPPVTVTFFETVTCKPKDC
jgi:hypothetical protein